MPRRSRSRSRTRTELAKKQDPTSLEVANLSHRRHVAGFGAGVNHTTTEYVNKDFDDIQRKCPAHCAPLLRLLKYIILLIISYSIYDVTITAAGAPSKMKAA